MGKIIIYSQVGCPYCSRVKLSLEKRDIPFSEIDIDKNPKQWEKLQIIDPSINNVPQIFFNYEYIGGAKEFFKLEEDGKLDEVLEKVFLEVNPFDVPNYKTQPTPSPTTSQISDRKSANKFDESSTDISLSTDVDDEDIIIDKHITHLIEDNDRDEIDVQKKIEEAIRNWAGSSEPLPTTPTPNINNNNNHNHYNINTQPLPTPPSSPQLNNNNNNNNSNNNKNKKKQIKRAIKEWSGDEDFEFRLRKSSSETAVISEKISSTLKRDDQDLWTINSLFSGNLYFRTPKKEIQSSNQVDTQNEKTSSSSNNSGNNNSNSIWKLFWFILKDRHLLCFREKNPKECFPIHSFFLKNAIIKQFSLKSSINFSSPSAFVEETPTPYYFSILIYSKGYHSYQFCSKSKFEMSRWVMFITEAINESEKLLKSSVQFGSPDQRNNDNNNDNTISNNSNNSNNNNNIERKERNTAQKSKSEEQQVYYLRDNSVNVTVSNLPNSEVKDEPMFISLNEPFISFWNKFLKLRMPKLRKKLSVKLKQNVICIGQNFTLLCKKAMRDSTQCDIQNAKHQTASLNHLHHHHNCTIPLLGNCIIEKSKRLAVKEGSKSKNTFFVALDDTEAIWLYVNSNYPHNFQVFYNEKSVLRSQTQPYFVTPKQHWVPGVIDSTGKICKQFISVNNNNNAEYTKLRIRVTPLLRHDVKFALKSSSSAASMSGSSPLNSPVINRVDAKPLLLPSQAWNLYDTPLKCGLVQNDIIEMKFNHSLNFTYPVNNPDSSSSSSSSTFIKFSVSNLSLSRRHIITIDRSHKCKRIKKMLCLLSEIPISQQTLLHNGKTLDDNKSVSSVFSDEITNTSLTWIINYDSIPPITENHPTCVELTNGPNPSYSLYTDDRGDSAWDYQRTRDIIIFLYNRSTLP